MTERKKTDRKQRRPSGKSILNLFLLVPKLFSLVRGILLKIKIETYFTIKNILILLMLALMLACLLTATWVSLLAILFFALIKLQWSWYAAAATVVALNVVFLIILGVCVVRIKNRISISEIAQHFSREQ